MYLDMKQYVTLIASMHTDPTILIEKVISNGIWCSDEVVLTQSIKIINKTEQKHKQ